MNFASYPGYPLKFICKQVKEGEKFQFVYLFSFYSPIARSRYIVRAEFYNDEVFAVKFYPYAIKASDNRYKLITNRRDIGNILTSCTSVLPLLLQMHPGCSIVFMASEIYDPEEELTEGVEENQRYRVYEYFLDSTIGDETFQMIKIPTISTIILINRKSIDMLATERRVKLKISEIVDYLPD